MDQGGFDIEALLRMIKDKEDANSPFAASDMIATIGDDSYDYARGGYADGGETDPMLDDDVSNAMRIAKNPYEGQVLSAPEPMSIGQFLAQNMRRSHETNIREFPQDFSNLAFVQGLKQLPEQVWESIKYPTMALKGELVRGVDPHTGQVTGVTPSGMGPTEAGMVGSGLVSAGALPDIMGGKVASNVLRAGASPEIEAALKTARELHPSGLYSHGSEVAANLPQAKGSADQLIGMLRNQGVRAEELAHAGLIDEAAIAAKQAEIQAAYAPRIQAAEQGLAGLAEGTPEYKAAKRLYDNTVSSMRADISNALVVHPDWAGKAVTREELSQHLQQSMPQVEETVLGKITKGQPYPEYAIKIEQEIMDRYRDDLNRLHSISMDYDQPRDVRINAQKEYDKLFNKRDFEIDEAIPNREQLIEQSRDIITPNKYGSYTLPGGENYRELLLKLPGQEHPLNIAQKRVDEINQKLNEMERNGVPEDSAEWKAANAELMKADIYEQKVRNKMLSGEIPHQLEHFYSSHWDDPNVLAHVRMSDRTGPNGEKLLHVEEIQSDWAQKGRKEGFAKPTRSPQEIEAELSSVNKERYKILQAAADLPDSKMDEFLKLNKQAQDLLYKARELDKEFLESHQNKHLPPNAPYVTNTQGWTDLALKRALKEAAEGGYEGIVFTPGAEQAKRYDLSKHIDELHWMNGNLVAYDKNGNMVIQRTGMRREELPEIVGKDVAEKLLAQEPNVKGDNIGWRSLEGQNLSIGGEGMKGYYDKIVPTQIQKLVKGLDKEAKLGKIQTNSLPEMLHLPITEKMRQEILAGQKAFAAGGAIDHALRLARETGGYISVSKRKHFDDGGDAGGGDGNGGDGGASSDAGNGNGDTGGGSGDNGASSDAGNGMGGAESSAAAADAASAADASTQDAAQASDVGSLGAGNAPSTDATQSAAEASDIGGLGSAAATSEVGQAAAAQSAANANAAMDAATEAATNEVSEEADLASPNATPTAMTNAQMVGAILGALAPVPGGAAIGYGIGSMMGGQQATTARDSNTPDATGVTGGNAGFGPSAADLGASSPSGYGGSSFGGEGGGAGGNDNSQVSKSEDVKEQPKQNIIPYVQPVVPTYTPQIMDYSDLGAANSISRQKLGSNLFNDALINPIYAQPQKNGGRVFKNNAVDNALKIAMVLAHKMEENPLLEDKIRSILLKL